MALLGKTIAGKLLALPRQPARQFRSVYNKRLGTEPYELVGGSGGGREQLEVGRDEKGFHVRFDMPGLAKEHVRVWVEDGLMFIRGDGPAADGPTRGEWVDVAKGRFYSTEIRVSDVDFKLAEMSTEVENGVLKVLVPARVFIPIKMI